MKFSRLCLRKYLKCDVSSEKIADTLTKIGFPTEILTVRPKGLDALHLAHVINKRAFVNDLNILTVEYLRDNTKLELEVVCGDTAVNIDDYVCMILIDEILPSTGKKLKSREIHGIVSPGMLCSADELGIASTYDGVCKFKACDLATDIMDCIYPAGDIFDSEVTYNRGDLLSVIGIARELSAAGLGIFQDIPSQEYISAQPIATSMLNNSNEYIRGAILATYSLQDTKAYNSIFLDQISQNTNVYIADLANEVVHEIGQPLHVYDADKIVGKFHFDVTRAEEIFEGLNGQKYKIPAGILIARDDLGIISIIGVLGGARTACSNNTKNIFLESVNISAEYMSSCMNILKINTKSAQLFLHEIDTNALSQAISCFNQKISMINKIDTLNNIVHSKQYMPAAQKIRLNLDLAKKVCAELWNHDAFEQTLSKLGFQLENKTEHTNTYIIPSYRFDIDCQHVLIAEYLRMYDYEQIACKTMSIDQKFTDVRHETLKRIRSFLAIELHEIITYKTVSETSQNRCEQLRMINPMSGVHYMRKNVLPSVLELYVEQSNRGRECNGMFEISDGFETLADILTAQNVHQTMYIAAIIHAKKFTLTNIEMYIQQLLSVLGIDMNHINYMHTDESQILEQEQSKHQKYYSAKSDALWLMQSDTCMYIYWKKIKIGTVGAIQNHMNVYGFELNLDVLLEKCMKIAATEYIDYQYIYTKDFSIKLSATQKTNDLLKIAQKIAHVHCKLMWSIFDVYPENRMIERNIGIRVKMYGMHVISNDEMSQWYNDTMQILQNEMNSLK